MKMPINMSQMMQDSNKKTMLIALGTVGGVAAIGVGALALYNSKQMRTARTIKRTGRVLYQVGTAMRDVSGIEK